MELKELTITIKTHKGGSEDKSTKQNHKYMKNIRKRQGTKKETHKKELGDFPKIEFTKEC